MLTSQRGLLLIQMFMVDGDRDHALSGEEFYGLDLCFKGVKGIPGKSVILLPGRCVLKDNLPESVSLQKRACSS